MPHSRCNRTGGITSPGALVPKKSAAFSMPLLRLLGSVGSSQRSHWPFVAWTLLKVRAARGPNHGGPGITLNTIAPTTAPTVAWRESEDTPGDPNVIDDTLVACRAAASHQDFRKFSRMEIL